MPRTLILGLALIAAGPVGVGPSAASAQPCYSADQVRNKVRAGEIPQIPSLASFLGQIRAGGYVVLGGQLCDVGGRFVYKVQVKLGGQPTTLIVDAITGAIN